MRRPKVAQFGCTLALAFAVTFSANLARADHTLTTAGGYDFVIDSDGFGDIDGSLRWDSNAFRLLIDGTVYDAGGTAPTTSMAGRQLDMAVRSIGGLDVSRHIYVPSTGGDFLRFLDVFENPGASAVTVTVRIETDDLNSDAPTATSSGDATVDVSDEWIVTGDVTNEVWGAVLQGSGRSASVSFIESHSTDDVDWEFELTVPPGGRVALLTYVVQADIEADAILKVAEILTFPESAFTGIEAYAGDVANFGIGLRGPPAVDEGDSIVFEVATAAFGDAATWSWDLDGDGTFGELANMPTYTIPAGTTDGDDTITVALEVIDGAAPLVFSKTVRVLNVAPAITSEPPTSATGAEYRYQVEADEPGGAADPLVYRLGGSPPPGMQISAEGLVTWRPPTGARGRTFSATVRVLDDDGGQDVQSWEIAVGANTPPAPPTPVSPLSFAHVDSAEPIVLTAENGSDPDGDSLTYSFQIAPTSDFQAGLIGSGDLPEGAEGTTSWTVPEDLAPGGWYWRVWVSDASASSAYRFGSFTVPPTNSSVTPDGSVEPADGGVADAGDTPPMPSGCSASISQQTPTGALVLLAMAAIVPLARRRRVRPTGKSG